MSVPQRFATMVRPDLATVAGRFPVPAGAALVAAILIVLRLDEVIPRDDGPFERALYGSAIAFTAGLASGILLEGRGVAAIIAGQLVSLAIGVGAALSMFSLWLTPPLLLASLALLAVAAPGFAAGGTTVRFWVLNLRSGFVALVGAVGTGAFVLGLGAILATLHSLFDIPVPDRLVAQAAAVSFVFLLPLYWLAFQPRVQDLGPEEPPRDILLRTVAALTDFIFLPLLVIYAIILHVYAAKIAISATLPRGQIGWMVSAFLSLGYLAFLLATPRQSPLPGLRGFFRIAWPPATLVPAVLLALALRERVQAYGVTEERYLIGIAAFAAVLLIVAWLPKRRLDPRLVPAAAAGLLLVAAVGPLSAQLVTAHSQSQRFVAMLDASGGFSGCRSGEERPTSWSPEARSDLQSVVRVLERRRGLHLIAPHVGLPPTATARELSACLGLERPPSPGVPPPILQSVAGYVRIGSDVLLGPFFSGMTQMVVFRAPDGPDYTFRVEHRRAVLSGPAGTFLFDLSDEPPIELGSHPRVVRAEDSRAVLIVRGLRWDGTDEARTPGLLSGEILLRGIQP